MPRNNATDAQQNRASVVPAIGFGLLARLLSGLGAGMRSDVGRLLQPLAAQCECANADASLRIAVMQLVFGGTQPLFGVPASRKSNRSVLPMGVGLVMLSLAGMYFARSFWMLMVALGVVFGCGAGAIAFGLGPTGDATVSPTSGLVSREFHVTHVATLVGVLFFCHQIGAFLSAWLGGVMVGATGGYALLWAIDICLCLFACMASLRIHG